VPDFCSVQALGLLMDFIDPGGFFRYPSAAQ
jgi:hypothetical protein